MPKQLKELRNFIEGVSSSPSASDIPDEAPIYSNNLEAIDEEGKLRGAKEDVPKLTETGPNKTTFNKGNTSFDSGTVEIPVVYTFTCYDDVKTYNNTQTQTNHFQNKYLYEQIADMVKSSKYVANTDYRSHIYNTEEGDEAISFYDTGLTIDSTNTGGLAIDETQIDFASEVIIDPDTHDGHTWFEAGRHCLIDNNIDTGNTPEVIIIGEATFVADNISGMSITRGAEDPRITDGTDGNEDTDDSTTAQVWSIGSKIYALGDYFSIDTTFESALESPTATLARNGVNFYSFDNSDYLFMNARNLLLASSRDDGQTFTRNNLIVYDKNTISNPPEFKLKVFKNFYEEGGENITVIEPETADVNSNDEGYPERVSLARGPNATFIGTGSAISSKPQWLGEIHHDRFGNSVEGFHLEDGELKAIDDDQTIFAINSMEYPLCYPPNDGSIVSDPIRNHRLEDFVLGVSDSGRYFYLIRNNASYVNDGSGDYLPPEDAVGKQFKHEDSLAFITSFVYCSKDMTATMSNYAPSPDDYWPYKESWKHQLAPDGEPSGDVPSSDGTVVNGHLNDENNRTVYVWTADVTQNNKLYPFAIQWHDPSDGSVDDTIADMKMVILLLDGGPLTFTHRIYITQRTKDTLGLNLDVENDEEEQVYINRPPKSGSYISDIFEKKGKIYILYGHKSGFTFDEEWLYVIDTNDFDRTQSFHGQAINAKPITPPVIKVKNWGKGYDNYGKDVWMPEDVFKGGLQSMQWIGQDWGYGAYANYVKWRNCDALGFRHNGKHVAANRNINGANVEADTTGGFNECKASRVNTLSNDDPMRCPGYNVWDHNYGNTGSNRQESNPYVEPSFGGWYNYGLGGTYQSSSNSADWGPSYGFENYVVFPQKNGLINYEDRDDIGVVAFVDGKQIQSGISWNHRRNSFQAGLFTWRREHTLWNDIEPVIKNYNEYVMFAVDHKSFGVSQRCMPYGTTYHRELTYGNMGNGTAWGWDVTPLRSISDSFLDTNGLTTEEWVNESNEGSAPGLYPTETDHLDTEAYDLDSDTDRRRPQKNAFRFGTYANLNTTGTSSGAKYQPSDEPQRIHNRHIYQFGSITTTQSGQAENSEAATKPEGLHSCLSVMRNYDPLDTDQIIMTVQNIGRPKYNTYITRWPLTTISNNYATYEPLAAEWVPENEFNPLRINNIGNGIGQMMRFSTTAADQYQIIISPTMGDFQTGIVKYTDSTEDSYVPATDDGDIGYEDTTYGTYFWKHPAGGLDFGLTIDFTNEITDITLDTDGDGEPDAIGQGNFMGNTRYYWKMTLLYDGYQEGPLSQFSFSAIVGSANYNTAMLTVRVSDPPKRVSHIVLYRKNSANDFFRMVGEVDLSKGWSFNAQKDQYSKILVDEGKLGPTYEAVTGMPESLTETIVNYRLSTVAQGHLIVADCYHPEIKQGQNFLFKSQPNAYSNFNWSRDYCVLPTKPTNIQWWAGKLYTFDLANMYRINIDNLVLEDTFEGIGCISEDTCITTDIGMFFCDYQGMYWHNGQMAENISRDIGQSSWAGDQTDIIETSSEEDLEWRFHSWQNINHNVDPKILFNPKTQSVYFCFQDKHPVDGTIYNGAWVYSLTRKRWDLIDIPEPLGAFTGIKNDIYLSGESKLWQLAHSGNERKKWSFYTKTFDFGGASQDKTFVNVNIVFNNDAEATTFFTTTTNGTITFVTDGNTVPEDKITKKRNGNKITFKIRGSFRKAKKLQVQLDYMKVEVDSIGMVYKAKAIK